MAEQTTADLSRRIAELVGDEGFEPGTCPQGHVNPLPFSKAHPVPIGELCRTCSVNEASERLRRTKYPYGHGYLQREWDAVLAEIDAEGHPEWRIGRGNPKPYAEDFNLIVPVVEAWCQPRKLSWLIHGNHWTPGRVYADIDEHPQDNVGWHGEQGQTPAEALALAFDAAVRESGAHA